jgi:hypothetical protein
MDTNQKHQKSLVFMEFFKIRKTKNQKNILIFINEKTCISVSVKYIEKVLANSQAQDTDGFLPNDSQKESA